MKEEWKDLSPEYEGYMISNYGNIVSFKKDVFRQTQYRSKGNYKFVQLSVNGSRKVRSVATLVANTFNLPNPLRRKKIRFIDKNPMNCRLDNLEWCTQNEIDRELYEERRKKFLKEIENGERDMG